MLHSGIFLLAREKSLKFLPSPHDPLSDNSAHACLSLFCFQDLTITIAGIALNISLYLPSAEPEVLGKFLFGNIGNNASSMLFSRL
jgi:hypothetical protein